jgi:hypothetical protein
MRALFLQNPVETCGVYAYGRNLYNILSESQRIHWSLLEPSSMPEIIEAVGKCEVCLVNYQAGIGGILASAPFEGPHKNVLVYHDLAIHECDWDRILFSDPTMKAGEKWVPIGRPLPAASELPPMDTPKDWSRPLIGVHGFIGGWSDQVVHQVMKEFEVATIRLSLPYATYGDATGHLARSMVDRCRSMVNKSGIRLEVSHHFMPQPELISWLKANDLNCYIRPPDMHWRGVSSAPDCAIAARRPLAVNKCSAFRHLHKLSPSICVEDSSLWEIIGNGLSPFAKVYSDWSPERIREQVEEVLLNL